MVRCSFEGKTFSRCVYIWVDTDFAIARGLHQGYPKKLGSIHQTRPHPYGPAPRIAQGGRFGASLAAADRRLAEARITLIEPSDSNGFVNGHPMAHNRTVGPSTTRVEFRLDEIIATGVAPGRGRPAVVAPGSTLRLFESPTEELHRLEPEEFIGAYYRQVGVKWDGGTPACTTTWPPEPVPAEVTTCLTGSRRRGRRGRHPALDRRPARRVRSAPSTTSPRSTSSRHRPRSRRGGHGRGRRGGRRARSRPSRRWARDCPATSAPRSCTGSPTAIEARVEDLAQVETRDNGSLLRSHRRGVMPRVAMNFRFFADHLRELSPPRLRDPRPPQPRHLGPGRRHGDHHARGTRR